MLREEKLFYQQILNNLDGFRRGILIKIHRCEFPDILSLTQDTSAFTANFSVSLPAQESPSHVSKFETTDNQNTNEEKSSENDLLTTISPKTNLPSEQPFVQTPLNLAKPLLTKIKFIRPTPKFIWKDMKEYGPFDPEEQIEIYSEVAELLIRKERAEKA